MNTMHIAGNFPHTEDFNFDTYWLGQTKAHIETAEATFGRLEGAVYKWVEMAVENQRKGCKIMFFGNGGSSSDAQHLAAEMNVRLKADRKPLSGLCLTLDAAQMTACANDYGYDEIFARQVQALGRPGDIAVGLTTSGNSPNVLRALEVARKMGIYTVGLTGLPGGKIVSERYCDHTIIVPHTDTARIQEMHITLGHIFVGALERTLGLVIDPK
jgi:D-sedoheptulose 7-phosphate isomerase